MQQLGMDYGTASNRLIKDILFSFIKRSGLRCYHCDGELTRETFSIEHKVPWLDSKTPAKLFFDLENISFSHRSCNIAAARRPTSWSFRLIKSGLSIGERARQGTCDALTHLRSAN